MIRRDATSVLLKALGVNFVNFSGDFTHAFEEIVSRAWASVTFTGARHNLRIALTGPDAAAAADTFLDGLAGRDYSLRGHFLAEIKLVDRQDVDGVTRLSIEALTVEDG